MSAPAWVALAIVGVVGVIVALLVDAARRATDRGDS